MPAIPLFDPADFHLPPGVAHVCAGGETAMLRRHAAAFQRYIHDKSAGMTGRARQEAEVERARAAIARLWGASGADIGFVSNVAEGVSIVAEAIDWRDGDNLVIDADEYPSVVGPIALRRHPRVALRIATGDAPDRLAALVDANTRMIGVSRVSYLTGERHALAPLRQAADAVGAALVVDFTQAAGYMPVDAGITDFAFSACYKWLLGVTGVAVAYWNRARQPGFAPTSAGWNSFAPGGRGWDPPPALRDDATRFTRGNPAHASVYVLAEALDYLAQFDPARVEAHVQGLTTALLDQLVAAQIPVMTPADPSRHGASVCVASPKAQALVDALEQRGVLAWNGHGRARFSLHGYNRDQDIERAVAAMRALWPSFQA
jgi:selenocysteine lyase/cysteine desulfurase